MKIAVVGGGPAGLYFAYLMKRQDAANEVRVYEQNLRDATFGFGVVFSDRALEFLAADDQGTYDHLMPHMEAWPDIKIVHRDEHIPIDGTGFAAIGRLQLLMLLQERALDIGVEIAFEHAIASPDEFTEADLIVGADGVNSVLRRGHEKEFGTTVGQLDNRFVWYGTGQVFDCLTLTFRENADGVFCAHHYCYSPTMSTFLVECDAPTWGCAGFEAMDDAATRAYCETVFAPDLGGHALVSNKSVWRNFPLIWNDRWSAGNRVLMGDALRTAHFSIGLGTRLAMEDAIALHRALGEEGGAISAAFARYEEIRRPPVEKIVSAANTSARWYERMADLMPLAPYEFAYEYMTRTGRVSDARLCEIAPDFMTRYAAIRAA